VSPSHPRAMTRIRSRAGVLAVVAGLAFSLPAGARPVLAVGACGDAFTPIHDIEGSGAATPIPGAVTTEGVVVGDYEYPGSGSATNFLRGFYLQSMDSAVDADPETSEGIFVFNSFNNSVNLGDFVRVSGTASETQDQTQIALDATTPDLSICSTANPVTAASVTFPVATTTYLERFEGMLVTIPQAMYVTEHFQLGRFGQVTLSSGGRLYSPTNVAAPGAPALAVQAANNLRRIILDDAVQLQNPDPIVFGRGGNPLSAANTLRGGDSATGIVGVMTYTPAASSGSAPAYRVRPINALGGGVPNFQPTNPRPGAPAPGGTLQVGTMNLLNFFNTFTGCAGGVGGVAMQCRGASNTTEFDRQWAKTVQAILTSGAEALGLNEIENDGYGPTSAIQDLVDKLNAATAPGTWAFIDVDAATAQLNALGFDAIKVGMIYQPAAVTPVGSTAVLNSVAFVNGGDGAPRSRPALAQSFEENATGERFTMTANHFKSKGSACDAPDAGDGQGNCNVVRTNAATALVDWLATDPTGIADPDILILGDLNSYAMEDPITTIKNAGYTNLVADRIGADAYSYLFDSQFGYLDHALGSPSVLSQVAGLVEWHIDSDEPGVLDYNIEFKSAGQIISLYAADQFRISDHDPLIVGLNLANQGPTVDAGGPYAVVQGSTVQVHATGSDPDGDPLTYAWDLDNNGSYETPGQTATFDATLLLAPQTLTIGVQVSDGQGGIATDPASISVVAAYAFSGFFPPISNTNLTMVRAGAGVPVSFSLGGDAGLDIFAAGYPASRQIDCVSRTSIGGLVPVLLSGGSVLTYNATTGTYSFVWKTSKSWKNTCRELVVVFADASTYSADFKFQK
jgi:predicted extracellular nuclease